MPSALEQVRTSLLTPVLSLLGVGGLMVLLVNPPLGHFNLWLCDLLDTMQGGSRLALGAVLGLLMATDYGGPINKAAYLTGTLALVNEQYDLMAAVMVGGMVPPIGVALACLFFKDRFTQEEQRTVPQNLLMGASFVTEGALSFALRDPLRVGPALHAGQRPGRLPHGVAGLRLPGTPWRPVPHCGNPEPGGLPAGAGGGVAAHGRSAGPAEKTAPFLKRHSLPDRGG